MHMLWLISACAYSGKWKDSMHLIDKGCVLRREATLHVEVIDCVRGMQGDC